MFFFFTWKKGAGTPYQRVPSQKCPVFENDELEVVADLIDTAFDKIRPMNSS